jgi:hypothetical protein
MSNQCLRVAACGLAAAVFFNALAQAAGPRDDNWFMTLGGVSSHARETLAPGREWNERHSGLGLERRMQGVPWNKDADRDWQARYTFGTLEDSRNYLGGYAGMGLMREVAYYGPLRLQAGAYATLYYRSTSWNGTMRVVPAILPALSLTEHRSGVGLNMVWVPPGRWGGRDTVSTLLVQLNYRVER